MRPQTQRDETHSAATPRPFEIDTCPSCRAELLPGMRFCRTCGYRLGEGVAEYAETIRLDGMPTMSATRPAAQTFGVGARPTTALSAGDPSLRVLKRRGGRCGAGAFTWLLVAFVVAGATGGGTAFIRAARRAATATRTRITIPTATRSFIGVDHFDYVRGEGLLLDAVLPGSPAHDAGLRDGDLVLRFDGRTIDSREDMQDALRRTPVGKTVEVAYARDGTARTTMLKTVAPEDYDEKAFMPPGGAQGYWGIDDFDRVRLADGSSFGVRLGRVITNSPADIAGLQRGDIVVTFNGDPARTATGLASYIHHAAPGSTVSVGVVRDGQRVEVPVKMGKD
jgi:membrane-associated protease RseP (regulator of RpoE activity)